MAATGRNPAAPPRRGPLQQAAALALAEGHARSGRLAEADRHFRALLKDLPGHLGCLTGLAGVCAARDDLRQAEALLRQALAHHPGNAEAHQALGRILRSRGCGAEAAQSFRTAVSLAPGFVQAHVDLAETLEVLGELAAAAAAWRSAIALAPRLDAAHYRLGRLLQATGNMAEAAVCYESAATLKPAVAAYASALGVALLLQGRLPEAEHRFRAALGLRPDDAGSLTNLATALKDQGRLDEAEACYRRALEIDPRQAVAVNNLGNLLNGCGRTAEAETLFRRALALAPDHAAIWNNLGHLLKNSARTAEAIASYRRAVALAPEQPAYFSNLLLALNYDPAVTPAQMLEEHRAFGRRFDRPPALIPPHDNDLDPERRLRVAYLSGDFCNHAVALLIEPVLRHHDPTQVEVFCYSEVVAEDDMTAHLKGLAHHWRRTRGVPDEAVESRMRRDRIDIAVDLAGHTALNRLTVLARKPAPVQVKWFGYPNTTGMTTIDYRLATPAGAPLFASQSTETVWPLEGPALVLMAPEDAPAPAPPPCLRNGFVTFGCFNNPAKLNAEAFRAWGRILQTVPGSRLLLKYQGLEDDTAQAPIRDALVAAGALPEQIAFAGRSPFRAYLDSFAAVDIALDPFPYNGCMTSLHGVWMGVPLVSLTGTTPAGQFGTRLLHGLGLSDLAATDVDSYVAAAFTLSADPERLVALRQTLRPLLAASPLMEHAALARSLESAYRGMWRLWCRQRNDAAG